MVKSNSLKISRPQEEHFRNFSSFGVEQSSHEFCIIVRSDTDNDFLNKTLGHHHKRALLSIQREIENLPYCHMLSQIKIRFI